MSDPERYPLPDSTFQIVVKDYGCGVFGLHMEQPFSGATPFGPLLSDKHLIMGLAYWRSQRQDVRIISHTFMPQNHSFSIVTEPKL